MNLWYFLTYHIILLILLTGGGLRCNCSNNVPGAVMRLALWSKLADPLGQRSIILFLSPFHMTKLSLGSQNVRKTKCFQKLANKNFWVVLKRSKWPKIKKTSIFLPKILNFCFFAPFGPTQKKIFFESPWSYKRFGTIIFKIEEKLGVTIICRKNYYIFRIIWQYHHCGSINT